MSTLINLYKETLEDKQTTLRALQKQIDAENEIEPRIPLEQKEVVLKREIEDLKQLIKGENRTVLDILISGMLDGQYYEHMKKVAGYTVDYIIDDCFIMEYAEESTADDVERVQAIKKALWDKLEEDSPIKTKNREIDDRIFYIPIRKGFEGEGIRKFISIFENEIGSEITILFKREITK
ncbi:hypothetical protein OQ471_04270 [Bacillus sp. KeR2]|uniref:hypothetical protein n=1 Tax=Bacillus sp. KeR2 TaxID=2994533 RepID=UPI00224AFA7D|nr:hypothetical protein [Bacillus sp. KeR2]MCX2851223.1 hypothetical protein [Bacillus sp. KeR2]